MNVVNFKTPISNVATLSSAAMLVNLTVTQWTARKLDKKVSVDIDIENNTTTRSGNYNKNLLAGDSALSNLQKLGSAARAYHNNVTTPWSDMGPRLLPTALFFDYKKEMARFEKLYTQEVDAFLLDYPHKIAYAQYTLGDLYNHEDYPTLDNIRGKFGLTVSYMPLPEAGDFRLDINNQGLRELQEQYQTMYNDSLSNAMQSVWDRLYDSLTRLSNGLRIENGKRGIIVQSTFDGAKELCDLLSHLNIGQDTKLESMRAALESAMYGLDVTDVRNSDYQRTVLKSSVDDILSKF
jgi:hypothetical protein